MKILGLRNRLPALYRWSRRRRYFPIAVLMACAILFLPLGIVGGLKISHFVTTNNALAATRAISPEHSVLDILSKKEQMRYSGTLSKLVIDNPETIYQLISHDFLVMFSEPELKRKEGKAGIWQYRTASCVLDIHFDIGGDNSFGAVTYYEVRQRKVAVFIVSDSQQEDNVDAAHCLEALYKQRSI